MRTRSYSVAIGLGISFAIQGCAQILDLDEERKLVVGAGASAGGATSGGTGGIGGMSGTGGIANSSSSGESSSAGGFGGSGGCGEFGGGGCTASCQSAADCDDGNPCSIDTCNPSTGECTHDNVADGLLTPEVTPIDGDCKQHICQGGLDTESNDDTDVTNDMNPCTDDICANGVPSNPPFAAKASCMLPAPNETNVCNGNGTCVECIDKDDCVKITESECEKRSCVNNKCVIAYEPQTTLASPVLQVSNDCKKVVCSGMAMPLTLTVNDDTDLPNDGFQCTIDTCVDGAPKFSDKAAGTMCGNGQVCNATGDCVGCTGPTDCMGTDDFCKTRTCNNNVCGYNYIANGTDLPTGQIAGDCKVLECDGLGNVKTSVLQSDVPVDGNACTQDVCNAMGTPSNPATAANSPCSVGMNDACDGMGVCKKSLGKTCGGGPECVSTRCVDGVCCNGACTTLCEACNVPGSLGMCIAVPKGTDDGTCSGTTQSCNGSNDCDGENGVACSAGSACLSNFCIDGVCCGSTCTGTCRACNVSGMAGTCTNIPVNTDPSNECTMQPTSTCGDTGMCDGSGACQKYSSMTVCAAQSCMGTTQTNEDKCNGSGTCVDNGTSSCDPYVCGGTACKTTCTVDDDCVSGNYCSSNACIPKKSNGQICTMGMGNQCLSGNCVDGVCCDFDCTATCMACNLTGSIGTCTNVPSYQEDLGSCSGDYVCGATGACKLKDGASCLSDADCHTAKCVDGVCCDSWCNGTCESCNSAFTERADGLCSPILADTDPQNECSVDCSAFRSCKAFDGQPCPNGNGECLSGYCANGWCQQPSCNDNVKNGTESEIDCGGVSGGTTCPGCTLLLFGGHTNRHMVASLPVDNPNPTWVTTFSNSTRTDAPVALTMPSSKYAMAMIRDIPNANKLSYIQWSGGSWGNINVVDGITVPFGALSLANVDGRVLATYREDQTKNLFYSEYDNQNWSLLNNLVYTLTTTNTSVGLVPSIAGLPNESLMIFNEFDGSSAHHLNLRSRINGSWSGSIELSQSTNAGIAPKIITLTNGEVMIAFLSSNSVGVKTRRRNTAGVWLTQAPLQGGTLANMSTFANIALAPLPNGGAIVAYRHASTNRPMFSVWNSNTSAWTIPAEVTTDPVATSISVTRGMGGQVAELAYIDQTTGNAKHTRYDGTTWSAPMPIGTPTEDLNSVAIAAPPP